MATLLQCTITTPEELVFEGEASAVVVPAFDGELGILPRHVPLVGRLGTGELRLAGEEGAAKSFFIDGGFVEILDNRVTVLAVKAELTTAMSLEVEEANLRRLSGERPAAKDGPDSQDAHARAVEVARIRARVAARRRS